jgi:hypothetical protein
MRKYKTLAGCLKQSSSRYLTLQEVRTGRFCHKTAGFCKFELSEFAADEFYRGITGVIWARPDEERVRMVSRCEPCGITSRLWWNGRRYEYCAGQDYVAEIRTVQRIMREG